MQEREREDIKMKIEEFMKKLVRYNGSVNTKPTDKQLHKIREDISKEYAKKFIIKLDI